LRIGNASASSLDRAALLRRGGGALLASGGLAALLAAPAAASPITAPDGDLASLRLLIGAELLALDFQAQALASGKLDPGATSLVKRLRADEQLHYNGLADLLSRAGQPPATADDIDFAYPKATFASSTSILKLAVELESVQLGAYIGANAGLQTPAIRAAVGQIAANEAQHTSALAALTGRPVIGRAFGPALDADAVTTVLNAYES
jgi:rubrerythrin